MELVTGLPFVIGAIGLFRLAYLKGWKGLWSADLRLRVPKMALALLLGILVLELLVGILLFAGKLDRGVAKVLLSPVWLSLVISLVCCWLLVLNWGEKAPDAE